MATKTDSVTASRVYQALQLVTKNDVWVGFGKTTTWGTNEPVPDVNQAAKTLDELQALKKAETLVLVVPDTNGTIEFAGKKYRQVAADKNSALTAGARFVYVAAWLKYSEVPVVTYRQSGVFTDVVKKAGSENKLILQAAEIQDPGYLLALNNRSPVTRETDSKELLEFLLEF